MVDEILDVVEEEDVETDVVVDDRLSVVDGDTIGLEVVVVDVVETMEGLVVTTVVEVVVDAVVYQTMLGRLSFVRQSQLTVVEVVLTVLDVVVVVGTVVFEVNVSTWKLFQEEAAHSRCGSAPDC